MTSAELYDLELLVKDESLVTLPPDKLGWLIARARKADGMTGLAQALRDLSHGPHNGPMDAAEYIPLIAKRITELEQTIKSNNLMSEGDALFYDKQIQTLQTELKQESLARERWRKAHEEDCEELKKRIVELEQALDRKDDGSDRYNKSAFACVKRLGAEQERTAVVEYALMRAGQTNKVAAITLLQFSDEIKTGLHLNDGEK